MNIREIAEAIILAFVAGYTMWNKLKERRAYKAGLKANPARCYEHESRLSGIDANLIAINKRIDDVCVDIHMVEQRLYDAIQKQSPKA